MPPELHLPDLPEVTVSLSVPLAAPAAAPAARQREPWPTRVRAALSAYLPLLLMVFLALGTWWLVQNSPSADTPRSKAPVTHTPDYEMERFVAQRYAPDGRLVLRLEGARLRHYPDTDELDIDTVRLEAWSPDGRRTLATARRALAAGDGQQVQLLGGAEVVSEVQDGPPLEVFGEALQFEVRAERLSSQQPVRLRQGATVLNASGMDYDNTTRQVRLKGPVRAVSPPATARR